MCFACGKNPGVECPGRKKDEQTRCLNCLEKFMLKERIQEVRNILWQIEELLVIKNWKKQCYQLADSHTYGIKEFLINEVIQ
jgi:DNA-directed RNA polymerase subunit RPC12/RpoP